MATPNQRDAHGASPAPSKRRLSLIAPAISLTLLLALIGAAGFILWQGGREDEPRSIAFPASDGTPEVASAVATPDDGFLWEIPVAEEGAYPYLRPLIVEGDTVFRFLSIASEFNGIEAIDGWTGTTLWRTTAYVSRGGPMTADEFGVYYFGSGKATPEGSPLVLVALSPETGDELWRLDIEDQPRNASAKDGRLYFDTDEDDVIAIDAVRGEQLWRYEGQSQPSHDGTMALPGTRPAILDHAIALVTDNGSLVGLDPETGHELWRSGGFNPAATFLTPAGNILVAMSAHGWQGMTGLQGTPSPDDEETLWAAGTANFRLVGINSADGRILWEQMVAAPIQYPAIAGSTFAFVGDEAIPIEEHNSIVPEKYWPSPVGDVGHVIYQWASYGIRAIDVESGELLWVETLNGDIFHGVAGWTSPSGSGGGIAAITSYGNVVAEGPWTGGRLDAPGGLYTVVGPLQAGDFGFVAQTMDGRLVGIPVDVDE